MRWHIDYHSPGRGLTFAITESLYKETSPYQTIEIVSTPEFGNVMLLDGVLMLTSSDEFAYHEMLCHPALFTHPNPEKVLIIGGGDCGTLKRVLQHQTVQSVIQVEIDEMVTRVAGTYFPELTSAADDPRAQLIFSDGIAYIREHRGEFDIILVDSTDPVGPAEGLFRKSFFEDCHKALKDDGILCIQSESPWIPDLQRVIAKTNEHLSLIFPKVFPYTAAIQTYQAGLWMFQMASKEYDPLNPDVTERIRTSGLTCRYYNENIHKACFSLPEFVINLLR